MALLAAIAGALTLPQAGSSISGGVALPTMAQASGHRVAGGQPELPPGRWPRPPFRGWAFPYNASTPDNESAIPSNHLYPPGTVNLMPTGQPLWDPAVATLAWSYCWDAPPAKSTFQNGSLASTAAFFEREVTRRLGNRTTVGGTFIGAGLDECNLGNERVAGEREAAAAGFRAARKKHPGMFLAGWGANNKDVIFASLMKDRTFDLAMVEGYSYCPGCGDWPASGNYCSNTGIEGCEFLSRLRCNCARAYICSCLPLTTEGWHPLAALLPLLCRGSHPDTGLVHLRGADLSRLDFAKTQGYLHRTVFCFGFILGRSAVNPTGWTAASLETAMLKVKRGYPELAGVLMYGHSPRKGWPNATNASTVASDRATTDLIRQASLLMEKHWPDTASRTPDGADQLEAGFYAS